LLLCQKRLKLSCKVGECKPLPMTSVTKSTSMVEVPVPPPTARGLHLSTFLLNVSTFCGDTLGA